MLGPEAACLALTVYYEARGESIRGQIAVAQVIAQRAEPGNRFPDTLCEVAKDGEYNVNGDIIRHKCQFSFWCDGKGEQPKDRRAWRRAKAVAQIVMNGYRIEGLKGALHYHALEVSPYWVDSMQQVGTYGNHIFYDD